MYSIFAIGLTVLTRCARIRIDMVNRLFSLLRRNKKSKGIYREDFLTKLGREQLKKITEIGLDLPVALL
jgi:hypothetical protein